MTTVSQLPLFMRVPRGNHCDRSTPIGPREERNTRKAQITHSVVLSPASPQMGLPELQSTTSSAFNKFIIWVLSGDYRRNPVYINGWKTVDLLLGALAERNPEFRVAFRGDCPLFHCGPRRAYGTARLFFETYLPTVSSKDFVKFEYIPCVENPYCELYFL